MAKSGVEVHEFSPGRLLRSTYEIVHVHWPEWVLRSHTVTSVMRNVQFLGLLQQARIRGARVVWTVHNLRAHESQHPRLERAFWKLYPALVDGYITLTADGREAVRARFPALTDRPAFVIPHGHYRDAYVRGVRSAEARTALDIPDESHVVAFLGQIRAYKNVPHLIRVFRACVAERGVLLVAGEPRSAALAKEVIDAAGGDLRVRLFLDFVPEERVQIVLAAADLVVLPFTELLNSGSAVLALSFDRPILVPAKGAMNELQRNVGAEWVRTYDGDFDVNILREALTWSRQAQRSGAPALQRFDWPWIAAETVRAYRTVHSRSAPQASEPHR